MQGYSRDEAGAKPSLPRSVNAGGRASCAELIAACMRAPVPLLWFATRCARANGVYCTFLRVPACRAHAVRAHSRCRSPRRVSSSCVSDCIGAGPQGCALSTSFVHGCGRLPVVEGGVDGMLDVTVVSLVCRALCTEGCLAIVLPTAHDRSCSVRLNISNRRRPVHDGTVHDRWPGAASGVLFSGDVRTLCVLPYQSASVCHRCALAEDAVSRPGSRYAAVVSGFQALHCPSRRCNRHTRVNMDRAEPSCLVVWRAAPAYGCMHIKQATLQARATMHPRASTARQLRDLALPRNAQRSPNRALAPSPPDVMLRMPAVCPTSCGSCRGRRSRAGQGTPRRCRP